MSLDFSKVKKITIPEGEVTNINDEDGNELWYNKDVPTSYYVRDYITSPTSEAGSTDYVVDTGITLKCTDIVYVKFKMNYVSDNADNGIFGGRGSTTNRAYTFSTASGKYRIGYGSSSTDLETPLPDTTTVHEFIQNNGKSYLDGTLIEDKDPSTIESATSCYLFSVHSTAGSHSYPGSVSIYSFRVIRNGVTIFNGIPVSYDEDGTLGIFDTIGQSYHSGWVEE